MQVKSIAVALGLSLAPALAHAQDAAGDKAHEASPDSVQNKDRKRAPAGDKAAAEAAEAGSPHSVKNKDRVKTGGAADQAQMDRAEDASPHAGKKQHHPMKHKAGMVHEAGKDAAADRAADKAAVDQAGAVDADKK